MDKLVNPTQNYTVVPNELFNIPVSASARFLYIYLISRPDGWKINAKNIMNVCDCGRDKTYAMLQELKGAGMLSYHRLIGGGGTYNLHEITTSGFSASGFSESDKSAHIVNTEKAVNTDKRLFVQNEFARWYLVYPKKKGKEDALKAFTTLTKACGEIDTKELVDRLIADVLNRKEKEDSWLSAYGKYIPLPATYLRGKRWEDDVTERVAEKTNGFDKAEINSATHDAVDFNKLLKAQDHLDPVDPYADLR